MEKGYLALVLHAHLPFVRHPEFKEFLEEDWLYEAITETYIPLLRVLEGLVNDHVDFRLTMSITPTLASMFIDPLLQDRYLAHLDKLIELTNLEIERTKRQAEFNQLAKMYNRIFNETRQIFTHQYHKNLIGAFKKFQDLGKLEIITCGATHGFLPLMDINQKAVRAQIMVATAQYEKLFGRPARGIWLPECGYHPDHDKYLKEAGINFFLVDNHGILHGSPRPKYGVFAPVYCRSGVAAFGRDLESSKAVWSAEEGYPGDHNHREFYRDIGFDLDYEYIRPFINADGTRINTGIKYYRITGKVDLAFKKPYVEQWAKDKAADQAGNFMFNREKQVEHLYEALKKKPIIVSPYDAELFGHWWYEGPQWLDFLFRKMHHDQKTVKLITPSEYLDLHPHNQVVTPSMSSWGHKGYNEVWLEGSNDWIYRYLHKAADRMVELAGEHPTAEGEVKRALNQAARELLLAQASDWAFIFKTGTCTPYAYKRTRDHIERFSKIYDSVKSNSVDTAWLAGVEHMDNAFPDIDYRVYS
ncbi:MAG: 1,4-alpha-glucan branching protein domain-containing protein [bacterium]